MKNKKKSIDHILKELGDLYDFNREIKKFRFIGNNTRSNKPVTTDFTRGKSGKVADN